VKKLLNNKLVIIGFNLLIFFFLILSIVFISNIAAFILLVLVAILCAGLFNYFYSIKFLERFCSKNHVNNFAVNQLSYPAFVVSKSDNSIIESNSYFKEYFPGVLNLDDLYKDSSEELLELSSGRETAVFFINGPKKHKNHICDDGCLDELLLTFFDASPIPNILIDFQGQVIRSNNAFIDMIGDKKYKRPGWLFDAIVDRPEREVIKKSISDIASHKRIIEPIEIKIIGERKIISFLFITRLLHHDLKEALLIHLIDITDHKNLEMNFAHSQKMQALGQLAGGVAHDFNNLLTAMLGFSDLLLMRHPAGDPSFSDIMQIKQNVNRATSLVRQLLAFSKKQVLNIQLTDANEILAELSNLIIRLIGENIKLNIAYDRELKAVKVDQGQLEQVIINLAVNARDSMSNGGDLSIVTKNITIDDSNKFYQKLITPFVKENIENGDYVLITVADDGCGIPKKLINQIFEPFFSTKDVSAGTGLGLSTVYGIIKQTDGYLFLETKENVGTKFYILLKAHEHEGQELIETENNKDNYNISSDFIDLSGSSVILIVEDEAPVREVSSYALKNRGYKVLEADNGIEAIKTVKEKEGKIDLIISDIIMPGVNGADMIKEVHNLYSEIRVIFISGYTEHALMEGIVNNQKIHFMAKPFSLKQLATKVKEVLSL
jgi:two-component system cell cycle sensor histidine kinase/response regulator CckA